MVPLDQGRPPPDLANLQTPYRTRHIAKTAGENRREPMQAETEWYTQVAELADRRAPT